MGSQFFGLNIAYSGLTAANIALNTTANNMSNAEVEGYSRQYVSQKAADALRTFTTYGCAGAGVQVLAIERIRDEFYDNKYWSNNTSVGEYDVKQYYMKQIEDYFIDSTTVQGFKTIFNEMMNALEEVQKNSGSVATKTQFLGFVNNLTDYFNSLAANLEQVQKDANQEINVKVGEINSIAEEIAALNKQINVIELSGGTANELRDRRALLIDQLSAITTVETREIPLTDPNNPDHVSGATEFTVKIAGGQTLVYGNEYNTLACLARESSEKVNQSDIDGLYDVYWVANKQTGVLGDQFNLYNASLGGELEGLVHIRDGNNNENFHGTVSNIGNGTVTISVTDMNLLDINKCTLSDNGGKINIGNQIFYYKDWSFDSETNSYTFTIDESVNDTNINYSLLGKEVSVGVSISYQGVPYYQQQLNEWVRIFSQGINKMLASGYDSYGNNGNNLFTGNMITGEQYTFDENIGVEDEFGNVITTVSSTSDSYYRLTAKNFTILATMLKDPELLATRTDPTAGVDEYGNITNLMNMINDKTQLSFRGATTSEFLTCVLSDITINASAANSFYNTYSGIGKSINNQRASISGVDNDEEAISLVKFQNSYNLASKMIQTLTEVYDRLILETGV
ncbi:MAG: flagellar hook-associated protein FlgK [Lachnospiraceae bacterium]